MTPVVGAGRSRRRKWRSLRRSIYECYELTRADIMTVARRFRYHFLKRGLPPGLYTDPALSPHGRFVALVIRDATGSHVWVHDLERGLSEKRTFEGVDAYPAWSRDGRYLIFTRGGNALMRVPADGSGTAEPFFTDEPSLPVLQAAC